MLTHRQIEDFFVVPTHPAWLLARSSFNNSDTPPSAGIENLARRQYPNSWLILTNGITPLFPSRESVSGKHFVVEDCE
jgi:hypothetical protein